MKINHILVIQMTLKEKLRQHNGVLKGGAKYTTRE